MRELINDRVVSPEEFGSMFVFGTSVNVAEECLGCDALDTETIKKDMFIIDGYAQTNLLSLLREDPLRHPPDISRAEKELVIGETERRARDGINGTDCKFICKIDKCWRKSNVEDEAPNFIAGHDLAIQADTARDDALRLGRLAKSHRLAARRLLRLSSEELTGPSGPITNAYQRAVKHQGFESETKQKANDAIDRHKALVVAAGSLLGLPEVPPDYAGQEDTFTVE